MTDEHVWVTIGGKPLYVGKVPEPVSLPFRPEEIPLKAKPKRKRPQYSPPQEIFDVDSRA